MLQQVSIDLYLTVSITCGNILGFKVEGEVENLGLDIQVSFEWLGLEIVSCFLPVAKR
jgi:hypothetical protein